jgi:hypothetical protein
MRYYIEIIADLYSLNLKTHTGHYSLSFIESGYEFIYHTHSTGRHLTIKMVAEDDSLTIYNTSEWFYSCYEFNERGKIQGFQIDGPWKSKVAELMVKFEVEIEAEKARRVELEANQVKEAASREAARIEKFRRLAGN